jgi:hypothetical protein
VIHTSVPGVEDFDDRNDGDREDSYDVFVLKLDDNGVYEASSSFGAASDDYGLALALSNSGAPIVAGQFRGTVQLGGGLKLRPFDKEDSYVALFDENLAFVTTG